MAKLSELFDPSTLPQAELEKLVRVYNAAIKLKHETWCDYFNNIPPGDCNCMLTDVYFALKDLNDGNNEGPKLQPKSENKFLWFVQKRDFSSFVVVGKAKDIKESFPDSFIRQITSKMIDEGFK